MAPRSWSRGELIFLSEGFADPVVGEGRVLDGRLDFRHVAGCAVLRAYRAGRAWVIRVSVIGGCFCAWLIDMTLQTARIVGRSIVLQRLMGIVTGNAGESSVGLAPTLAVFQAVRRKAEVQCAKSNVRHHIFPGAVARAAEIHGLDRIQAAGIHDQLRALLVLSQIRSGYMTGARSVAGFAGDARHSAIYIQLIVGHRRGCVTGKTRAALCRRHATSRGVFKAARRGKRLPRSDIQILGRRKKSQMAFVVVAVFLVDIGLAQVTDPKCPQQVCGESSRAVSGRDR